jgi:uncharacterized protein DUF6930
MARKRKQAADKQPVGPLPSLKEQLKRLPQDTDVWQADFRRAPIWVEEVGGQVRPWLILVANCTEQLVLAHALVPQVPSPELLWDTLSQAMKQPLAGDAHRPGVLELGSGQTWQSLHPHFKDLGIESLSQDQLDPLDFLFEQLLQHLAGPEAPPGLIETPGMTPEQIGSFFDAAAFYYVKAPWCKLGDEETIKVECERIEGGPWYAVIIGQAGISEGLVIYDELEPLTRLRNSGGSDEENAFETVALSFSYGDESEIAIPDLDAIQQYGWKVASPEAYPVVFRKEEGTETRPPLPSELDLLEGCLRAVPQFVAKREPGDPAAETIAVPSAAGELKLVLSWVPAEAGW